MLAPWKKSYDQPRQHIKKQRHYFSDKGLFSQSYVFSSTHVWMWELDHKESWALKNWCFELWCWRRFLRVPGTGRRSNQSILKEISPEYSLENWWWSWNSNILATWYEEALQTAVKRREAKSKGEKERYKHLNAEFQRTARRDTKAFFSDQCKEIEENNRMGKTRDLVKRNRWGNSRNSVRLYFGGLQNHCRWWLQPWN